LFTGAFSGGKLTIQDHLFDEKARLIPGYFINRPHKVSY